MATINLTLWLISKQPVRKSHGDFRLRKLNMEDFVISFLESNSLFSSKKLLESVDFSTESDVINFLQKLIFKPNVVTDLKKVLNSACSSEHYTVSNTTIKKVIVNLHELFLSNNSSQLKIDGFCYVFKSFAQSFREEYSLSILQFFALLCHILGLNKFHAEKTEETDDCVIIINKENFQDAFQVDVPDPILESFQIVKELLGCLSRLNVNLKTPEAQEYYKWFKQFVKILAKSQPLESIYLDLFSACAEVDVKLIEVNVDHIFAGILSQNRFNDKIFCDSYERFFEEIIRICSMYQRIIKFVSKLLSIIKETPTESNEENIVPAKICNEFSKAIAVASSQQSLSVMEILVNYVDESCKAIAENKNNVQQTLFGVTSKLFCSFFNEVKIFAPSIPNTTVQAFIKNLNFLIEVLRGFGTFLFSEKNFMVKNENVSKSFLELCFHCGEIQTLVTCYSISSEIFIPNDEYDCNCCLSSKQWASLVKIFSKSKLNGCDDIFLKLFLQRLRILKLQRKIESLVDDSTTKVIVSHLSSSSDDFVLFQRLSPEDMSDLMEILTVSQSKLIAKTLLSQILEQEVEMEYSSWLSNGKLLENSNFVLSLFAELLKATESALFSLGSISSEKSISKMWLSDEYFDEDNNIDVKTLGKLPNKINRLLQKRKKFRTSELNASESVKRIFSVFKCLPLVHMEEEIRQLGLSFTVGLAVVSPPSKNEEIWQLLLEMILSFLSANTDPSICFDISLCIEWLSEMSFQKSETNSLKLKVMEGLVRNCPNTKFGLTQLGQVINEPKKFEQKDPLKILETQVVLYQELGKCWLRAKKRKADNDIIGDYRTKLAKFMSEETKNLADNSINAENYKVLLKIFAIELNLATRTNDDDLISSLMKDKFESYLEFTIKQLKEGFDEISASFLSVILQVVPKIRQFIGDDCLWQIWEVVRIYGKANWNAFAKNTNDEEFKLILSDLLQSTKDYLNSPTSDWVDYFDIWVCFFDVETDVKKKTLQLQLQELFHHINDSYLQLMGLPIRERIRMAKFFSSCVSSKKIIMTPLCLDAILNTMLECPREISLSMEDFHDLFTLQIETASSILLKQFTWIKNKIHLNFVLFKEMLNCLVKRSDVALRLNNDDVMNLSACGLYMEKWTSFMIKERKDFSRIAPYFITAIVSSIASVTVLPAVKIHLINCINNFLSISDSHTISYLLRVLKPGYQQVFNSVYDQFKKYYKYSGKI